MIRRRNSNYGKTVFLLLLWTILFSHCSQNQGDASDMLRLPLETGNEYLDIFMADGDSLITRPQHLGIVNGMASVGISHDYVGLIDGLWAQPYVSSDFLIEPRIMGERIRTEHYTWLPFQTQRIGELKGIHVKSTTTLIQGTRAGVLSLELKNRTNSTKQIPVQFITTDPYHFKTTLDYVKNWGFDAARSRTPVDNITEKNGVVKTQGEYAIAMGGDLEGIWWEESTRRFHGTIVLEPGQEVSTALVFSIGAKDKAVTERDTVLKNPAGSVKKATETYISQVKELYSKVPRFYSDNKGLEQIYNRSLSIFITNKAEVPEFVVNPHYGTGAVKGGCTCNYLYNFGQVREILNLIDPQAVKQHILQFLRKNCVNEHYAFYPMTGEPFGAWYMVNHEKITGLVYHYVQLTGDIGFLKEKVKDGKTVLDLMIDYANHLNEKTEPVKLIDYGPAGDHLELGNIGPPHPYNHVMPDMNGRRYHTYFKVSELCEIAGYPQPYLMERAEELKKLLKQELWDPEIKWFRFADDKGNKDVRYTIQMYKMFDSDVLDEEVEQGLLSHLNDEEFFSEYGLHSMSKRDDAYDQADIDNGGGGICTSFPPLISEFLYKDRKVNFADKIMGRILWWGMRMPYFCDSQVANAIEYRPHTPLQSNISTGCLAQCILFGMFGIDVGFDGTITINPVDTKLAGELEVKGLKIRGKTMDISVKGENYEVVSGNNTYIEMVGNPTVVE